MSRPQVSVSRDTYERIKLYATAQGVSIGDVVEAACAEVLDRRTPWPPELRAQVIGKADELGVSPTVIVQLAMARMM